MGIQSKNREEWVLTDIANMFNSVVTVPFYDSHGPKSISLIVDHTELTTIACSGKLYIDQFIKMKEEEKLLSLKNIISFEEVE